MNAIILGQVVLLIAIGVAGLALRSYIKSFAEEKGKNAATKQDIDRVYRELERLRSEFAEHQTEYSLFFEKRFTVVGDIYGLLHDAREYVNHMVHPIQVGGDDQEQERQRMAYSAYNELSGYF